MKILGLLLMIGGFIIFILGFQTSIRIESIYWVDFIIGAVMAFGGFYLIINKNADDNKG